MTKEALFDVKPLPPFMSAKEVWRSALPSLKPHNRISVSETAPKRSIQAGGQWVNWRADVAPYMTEPMDTTTSRRFDSVAFVGPARSSKSEGLVINPINHAIQAQPRVVAMFSPSKDAANEWSIGQLDPLILNSPELSSRLLRGKGGDNVFGKKFRGGCRLTIDWPVASKLAQRSIDLAIGTDFDLFPDSVGEDGGAFGLMRKRTESAGSRGMTIVESSPRKMIMDENWTPETAHEAPPCGGILGIYNAGSRGRLYWTCLDCAEKFEPRYDRLVIPVEGSPVERGSKTYMACPHCGSVIEPKLKAELNRSANWWHECNEAELVPLYDLRREVSTASYWLHGPAAALAPWSRIVSRTLEAEDEYAKTGGENTLKAVTNTEKGLPYLPRSLSSSASLSKDTLKDSASDHAWQVCPPGTRFVTFAIDVQKGRFVGQAEAWLSDLERVVIDRFDIVNPPENAPAQRSDRAINPGLYTEDWDALLPIFDKVYPVSGSRFGLKPLAIICDLRGEPGVTPNARDFYRKMRILHRNRFYLVQGVGGDNAKRAVLRRPETSHSGKAHAARDVPAIYAGTDRLKDEVAASLIREDGGSRKLHVSRFAPDEIFGEYAAERRTEKGWRKRPGVDRNEALDLSCYALALVIVLEAEAVNFDKPPSWATAEISNIMAMPIDNSSNVATTPAPEIKKSKRWAVSRPQKKRW